MHKPLKRFLDVVQASFGSPDEPRLWEHRTPVDLPGGVGLHVAYTADQSTAERTARLDVWVEGLELHEKSVVDKVRVKTPEDPVFEAAAGTGQDWLRANGGYVVSVVAILSKLVPDGHRSQGDSPLLREIPD